MDKRKWSDMTDKEQKETIEAYETAIKNMWWEQAQKLNSTGWERRSIKQSLQETGLLAENEDSD